MWITDDISKFKNIQGRMIWEVVCKLFYVRMDGRSQGSISLKIKGRLGLSWWLSGKACTCQCMRPGFEPWVREIPWRRKWEPTPVFLPGKFHGQRSLVGYSPWGCKRIGHNLAAKQPKGGWVPNSVFKQVALYHVNKLLDPILEIHTAPLPYFKLPW